MINALRDRDGDGDAESANVLKRIAIALGEPEDAFYKGSEASLNVDDTCALIRAWEGLRNKADRQKLLAFAQTLAAQG